MLFDKGKWHTPRAICLCQTGFPSLLPCGEPAEADNEAFEIDRGHHQRVAEYAAPFSLLKEDAEEAVDEAAEEVKEAAEDAVDAAAEKAEDVKDAIADAAEEAKDKVADFAENIMNNISDKDED